MQKNKERTRLNELHSYYILEKDIHEELEGLTKLASKICNTPISLINLLDEEHQITKSSQGWDINKITKESSFCQYTILDDQPMIIQNAKEDDRFKDSPFVKSDPHIRFYAGIPLISNGQNIGAICVIDKKPRTLSENQREMLDILARETVSRLELIKNKKKLEEKNSELIKSWVFLNNSSDVMAIIDPDSRIILEADDRALDLLGGSPGDFEGNKFGDRITDEDKRNELIQFIQQTEQKEGTFEAPVRTNDNDILYLEHSFTLFKDKWYMTARDITNRKKAEDKLHHTLTKLNYSQELANVGGWRWEPQTNNLEWTEKIYDIYGVEDENKEPTLDLLIKRTHPEDRERALEFVNQINNGGIFGEIEKRLLLPDGTVKWVKLIADTKFDQKGRPEQVYGAVEDITDSKRAAQRIKKQKDLSDQIIASLPIPFFMFDENGNALRWNDQLTEQSGYNDFEIPYMEPSDFFAEEQRDIVKTSIEDVHEKGEQTLQIDIRRKDGQNIPFLFNTVPFEADDDRYIIGTGQNISELKDSQQQLKSSLKEKEILLSEVHHRVKNNLAIISGLLQMEGFNTTDEHSKNVLRNSQMRIQSMAQIHELLYQAESFSELPFREFIEEIIDLTKNLLDDVDTDISFNLEIEDISLNVNQAIPCGLIINEITTNAYKHAFEGLEEGEITISFKQKRDQIELRISDNGVGLGEDFSIDQKMSLGFTLIRTLTRQLNADLNIKSNNGTEFILKFQRKNIKGSGSALK